MTTNPYYLSPATLTWLNDLIQTHNCRTIIECGSGQSTLHLAQLQAQNQIGQIDRTQLTLLRLTSAPQPITMLEQPKVSLITTIYNREAYLPETIESILTQTHQNLELILWDDGSTDDSLEICHHYAAQDDRIRVIAAEHQGRGPAVAQASAIATGKYIGVVDSDDLLAATALTETVHYLETHSDIGMVYTDYIIIDENGAMKTYGQHCQIDYDYDRLLTEFIIFHFRLMHTRIYHQIGGFDPAFMYCQDYDLCLRLSEVTNIAQLRRPLYQYRHHTQSISCEKRVDQIFYGKKAIENALDRRNMTQDYDLEFQVFARCSLIKKNNSPAPCPEFADKRSLAGQA